MCVAGKHGLVIVSNCTKMQLCMYSLADGSLVRSIGGAGSGKGQFDFFHGGLCVSPDGDSVLVAESRTNRVQQVLIVDGSWVRFVGEGVACNPHYVDCNADFIAVSESWFDRISVFLWAEGTLWARFGSEGSGPGELYLPGGIRLLIDGSGVVVADAGNDRLCVFGLSGEFVAIMGSEEQVFGHPRDVLECASDGGFVVANVDTNELVKFSKDGSKFEILGKEGQADGEFCGPSALAALPDGGLVVRESNGDRFQVFHGLELRKAWITMCVTLATRGRGGVTTKRARVRGSYGITPGL
jgi:hypothetical protein